ncbi:MAG TPA: UDP-N-acetylglucosamine--N-acetylmuramyl-(pentapeptide) pyrophosphoryl-undecaprenol N-acetylglucosamine transferase [Candidatus Chromulinivoraceae bacterium]|nr:UDP-N-acetylglucosamine--N-acetylmuramyl-(pentapeptide) pyrophosphoryl-undecaprenol N-acetylglucosamine transferase [Candidatus Chromulinivoraceae bacterium]
MKILAVGGGSGGHVTPVVAVLRELKKDNKSAEIRFWCDRKFAPQARSIMEHFDSSIPVETILSGKLRRYHNLPLWRQLLRPVSIVLPNIRDAILVGCGFVQSLVKLLLWKPDVVFTKGGFVCLPVGMAAKVLNIPLVIHDSDAHPGLTNRVLAKWATQIATGAPLKFYPYPENISHYVGIPINTDFRPFSASERQALKVQYGFNPKHPLVVVTGGGLGAKRINDAIAKRMDALLEMTSLVLISGTAQYDEMRALTPDGDPRYQLHAFVSSGMAELLGAADVVVTRAGATTILELAALAKPTILVPNGFLTGGHQLKNASVYAENGAVEVIDDHELNENPQLLVDALTSLLANPAHMEDMSRKFIKFSKPDAAKKMAEIILSAVK